MEFPKSYVLFVLSLLCLHSRAESSGSVLFIDSSSNQFLRKSSSDHAAKLDSILDTEAASAVSVLLGFAPQSTLTADGSSKLNQILVPNPFQRPRAVFMLKVSGVDEHDMSAKDNDIFSSALTSDIVFGSQNAEIQLPAAEEVSVLSLDEKSEFTSKAISNFVSWIRGTYACEVEAPLNGQLTIPLSNGDTVKFYLSKTADREFISNIINLVNNLRNGIELHKDLSHGIQSPAELLTGSFDGIKALQNHYGSDRITQHGKQILRATLSKMYEELQVAYNGQIVGVIVFLGEASPESSKLSVAFVPQRSARWLAETEAASIEEAIRVALVRRVLAWLTGIILLISTLLGIYFLMYMQVTKDTLLYSNVKLD